MSDVPKVMAPFSGRPFLDLLIEYLKSQHIERIVLCTGYKADMVEDHYRTNDFGITIDFSRENEPLGTGGALANTRDIVLSDPFFVLNGDSFLPADLQAFFNFHKDKKCLASILVTQVKNGKDFGNLVLDANSRIINFKEKKEEGGKCFVNAGVYCFNQEIFSCMPDKKVFSIETDLFPSLLGDRFCGYRIDKEFMDIGTPARYEAAKQRLKKG